MIMYASQQIHMKKSEKAQAQYKQSMHAVKFRPNLERVGSHFTI